MRFKIDENLPVEIRDVFIRAGFEATTVGDEALSGNPDTSIAAICQAEQRVIVTLDPILPISAHTLPPITQVSWFYGSKGRTNSRY